MFHRISIWAYVFFHLQIPILAKYDDDDDDVGSYNNLLAQQHYLTVEK